MSDDPVFYTNPMSRGRMVRWMLEEVGVSYRTEILDYGPAMKSPAYLAVNPMGKVPALVHRGTVITECAAICAWLADAYPQAGLAPAIGDPARAAWLRALFFAAGPMEAAISAKAFNGLPPADKAGQVGYGSFDTMVDGLEALVSGPAYVAGDRFSAADVYLGSQVGWGLMFKSLPERPAFAAYWARIADRPAAVRARALDDALIPAR
jgi:glutathione S-transferase